MIFTCYNPEAPCTSVYAPRAFPARRLQSNPASGLWLPICIQSDIRSWNWCDREKHRRDAREGGCWRMHRSRRFRKRSLRTDRFTFNVPKILEVTLHNGTDPVSGKKVSLVTGDPCTFRSYEELYDAFLKTNPLFCRYESTRQQLHWPYVRQIRSRHFPVFVHWWLYCQRKRLL